MRKSAATLILVVLAAAAAAADVRSAQSGTLWVGTVGFVRPTSSFVAARRANARLVVSAATVDASFEGYTGATHDSPSARTSCSIRYRLVKRQRSWSYYHQVGNAHLAGAQYVQNAPCEFLDHGALKTRMAGSKLRADFSSWDRDDPDQPAIWRAYLRRG